MNIWSLTINQLRRKTVLKSNMCLHLTTQTWGAILLNSAVLFFNFHLSVLQIIEIVRDDLT